MTVKTLILSSRLGFCNSHEHLFIEEGQSSKIVSALKIDNYDQTTEELMLYKKSGGSSIVDAQPVGCGRNASKLLMASIQTGINIIAATGFHKLGFYPEGHWLRLMDEVQLSELFISEIEQGMYILCDNKSPSHRILSKPGVIKTASDVQGPIEEYEKYFIAAAKASRLTGVPILSHTEMGKGALEQVRLFTSNGVLVDSIILCHIDRTLKDLDYILEVAKTGVYMEFDTIGRFKYHSDEEEAQFIVKMVERGYEDRILLGLDCTRERMKSYGAVLGLDYINTVFIPLLRAYGLQKTIIDKFMIYNPAKAFTIKKT